MIEIEIPRSHPLTLDRRSFDSDGRLTATNCVLTRANVCPYIGREIPDFQQLGLDPDRVYQLYRDADALRDAMPGLNGKPLLLDHANTSALAPQQQLVVGTVSDCRWDKDCIVGTVNVWDATAISAIEANTLRDLSCGYRYKPVLESGTAPDGTKFDLKMGAPIEFNHLALVSTGRVDGAMVADHAMRRVSHGVLAQIEAERERVRIAHERSPIGRLVPGYNRLR